jgi:O-antigen/teichoic acid export membrane protein
MRGIKFSAYETVTSFVLGLASAVLTARVFGPAVIGAFALASALTGSFQVISNVREQSGLVRELTRYEPRTGQASALTWVTLAFSSVLTAVLLVPFVFLAIALLRGTFDRPELVAPFLVLCASYLLIDNTSFNVGAPLVAYRDARAVWFARTAMVVTTIAAAGLCGALGFRSVWGLVACTLAASAIGLAVRVWAVGRLTGLTARRADLRRAKARLRAIIWFGARASPLNYAEMAAEYADTAILAAHVPLAGLGAYNRAYGLYKRIGTIPLSLSRLYFPTQCALWASRDLEGMAQTYRLTTRYLVLLVLPGATWVAVSATGIMALFGPGFVPGATALGILAFTVVFDAYGRTAGGILSASNQPGRVSLIGTVNGVANVVLCLALIPQIGLVGAALANLAGWVLGAGLFMGLAARRLGRSPASMVEFGFLLRLGVGCALFALLMTPLQALGGALIWSAVCATPALLFSLALTRPLSRADGPLVERGLRSAGISSPGRLRAVRRLHTLLSHGSDQPAAHAPQAEGTPAEVPAR